MMAHRTANIRTTPQALVEALSFALTLAPNSEEQKIAQRDITSSLENALDARRQRILISASEVNLVKWSALILQAVCALIAIAMVHSDNRLAAVIALVVFAAGVATSVLLIVSHDRPFIGQVAVGPEPLLQVMPQAEAAHPQAN